MNFEPIATSSRNELAYRDVPVADLIGNISFSQLITLMVGGMLPRKEGQFTSMLDALLVAWADHGEAPPSTQCARLAASCGVSFLQAATSAFSCFGEKHGPVEAAALFLEDFMGQDAEAREGFLVEWMDLGNKVPGFGHPLHTTDPRIGPLLRVAVEQSVVSYNVQALHDIEKMLAGQGREIPVNLAGITAALWLDMALPARGVGLIALAGRAVGLAAHYVEVVESGQSFIGTPPKT